MSENPYQSPTSKLTGVQGNEKAPVLWNPDVAGLWSLLLSPVFGSIIISKNWKDLGERGKSNSSKVWVAVSVPAYILMYILPHAYTIYIIIWYFFQNRPQTKYLKKNFSGLYPKKGWLKPVLIAIATIYTLAFLRLTVIRILAT